MAWLGRPRLIARQPNQDHTGLHDAIAWQPRQAGRTILGPTLVFGLGMGLELVSLTLMAVSNVAERESGAASGVLHATQQVGGSLGLSILVTAYSTTSRHKAQDLLHQFLAHATQEERRQWQRTGRLPPQLRDQVLTPVSPQRSSSPPSWRR